MSESRALWWLLCWTISCLSLQGALCVAIWKLSVPRWVPNGTEEPVLLDCEYVYNEHDVRLVVKWFFNDLLEPVYQWIPELNSRQASGILAGHLDDSSYTGPSQYRALRIIRPTTEMSGLYTCVVSSLAGIDSRQQSMMVYVPARNFTLTYVTTAVPAASPPCRLLPGNGRASTRRCSRRHHFLSGADIEWPLGITPDMRRTEVQRGRTRKTNGTYDIELWRSFNAEQLPQSVTFECVLEIPGTDYEVRRRTVYSPGYLYLTDTSHKLNMQKSWFVLALVVTLLKNSYAAGT
ncbi:hypothetical protein MRX96_019425 [Rhipicephalus microplus]